MKYKVLIVTSSIDVTCKYITNKYDNMSNSFILYTDRFSDYIFRIDSYGWIICNSITGESISKEDILSIYYRKPLFPDLTSYEPKYRGMIQRDILAVIDGLVDSFEGVVLTKPCYLRCAENKIFQLQYAISHSILIPDTYIGNSREACLDFYECLKTKKAIIKPISTGKVADSEQIEVFQTQYFRPFDEEVFLTPINVQNYIEKKFEVRLTVINSNFYAVKIETPDKLDWRSDYSKHKYSVINCPEYIKNLCQKLLDDFNLRFGAFDFIVTPDDKWVFLEVNPNGQWLWLEQALNLDISQKIVEYLCGE